MTFINMYVPNIRAPKCIKQMLTDLKGKVKKQCNNMEQGSKVVEE